MLPWKTVRWPTDHSLSFASLPEYVTQGSEMRIRVFDLRGELPPRVELWYRSADELDKPPIRYNMRVSDSVAEWTLSNLRQPFQLRAVGGDDNQMEWVRVNVVRAPAVVETALWLTPPEYTEWPRVKVSNDFRSLPGALVFLEARADRRLRSAALVLRGDSDPVRERVPTQSTDPDRKRVVRDNASTHGRRQVSARPMEAETPATNIPLVVSANRRQVSLHESNHPGWRITSSTEYLLEFVDTKGVVGLIPIGTVTVHPDRPPEVDLREPHENWIGGSRSRVRILAHVSDDLSVSDVQLVYRLEDRKPQQETFLPLFRRTNPPRSAEDVEEGPEIHPVDVDWNLSQIPDLQPGSVISWYLTARDNRNQETTSQVRTWILRSDEDLNRRFARQEQRIVSQLRDILLAQQSARQSLQHTLQSLRKANRDKPSDPVEYQTFALAQRNVRERLTEFKFLHS